MISTLKQKNGSYYCTECMMRQFTLRPQCSFCGAEFSNYQDIIIENARIRHNLITTNTVEECFQSGVKNEEKEKEEPMGDS